MASKTLHVFADDSLYLGHGATGAIAIYERDLKLATEKLDRIKKRFGAPTDARLHCRELFSGDARAKSSWSHLGRFKVQRLYREVCEAFADVRFHRQVAYVNTANLPASLPAREDFPEIRFEPKSWVAITYKMILVTYQGGGVRDIKFWIDWDESRIEWLGRKAKFANAVAGFALDNGEMVIPERYGGPKPCLLEVADCIAYVAAHKLANRDGIDGVWFREMYQVLQPLETHFEYPSGNSAGPAV